MCVLFVVPLFVYVFSPDVLWYEGSYSRVHLCLGLCLFLVHVVSLSCVQAITCMPHAFCFLRCDACGIILLSVVFAVCACVGIFAFLKVIINNNIHVQHRFAQANDGSTYTTKAHAFHALLLSSKHY